MEALLTFVSPSSFIILINHTDTFDRSSATSSQESVFPAILLSLSLSLFPRAVIMQIRIHLIKEGISAQARNRAERLEGAREYKSTKGEGGSPFTPFPCEVLFIFRPISNYQDERAGERTKKRTNERESRRQRRKGAGIQRESVRDRDSSLGSHVLSQFAVVPRPSLLLRPRLHDPPVPLFRASVR